MRISCVQCKGRYPKQACGRSFCPILAKSQGMFKVKKDLKVDFAGSAPSVFVGHHGYPKVNVGLLAPEVIGDTAIYDAPKEWSQNNLKINNVIDYRSALINSRFQSAIKIGKIQTTRLLETAQETSMSKKPVDLDVSLISKPLFNNSIQPNMAPMGPSASLKRVRIESNVKVDTRVDKVVSDTDLKAKDAIFYLDKKKFDENFLTKLLSVGNLGVKNNRTLVPTRWSITAVDDMLGKKIINEIKDYNETNYNAYFGGHMGNYFLILTFPHIWCYELFETYLPDSLWNKSGEIQSTTDYENHNGRKQYAFETSGGYYAARLAILEKLKSIKRQGAILALRLITSEYYCPLGVWVVREAVRKAMSSKPIEFADKELMLLYTQKLLKKKFSFDPNNLIKKSKLLYELKTQPRLSKWFNA